MKLNLAAAEPMFSQRIRDAVTDGDAENFVSSAKNNMAALALVADNLPQLQAAGIYERCLMLAWSGCRVNNHRWSDRVLKSLFRLADRDKLLAAGDALPGAGPFRVYRGVAGKGKARRLNGISWTASLDCACWFALRWALPAPAVMVTEITAAEVLAYDNGRNEQEFIVLTDTAKRLALSEAEIRAGADRVQRKMEANRKAMIESLKQKGNRP